MVRIFRNSVLPVLLVSIFILSGCACKQDWRKSNMLKGAIIGIIPGAIIGGETSDNDDSDEIVVGIVAGAVIGGAIGALFDTCEPEPVVVAKAPDDTDTDGDGVEDRLDQCPDTPDGVPVDYKGCPKDSDGDGVYDNMDKCPDTPKGVRVDSDGCPEDSDGDGVYNYLDECPGTPAGVEVDSKGCPKDSDKDGVLDSMDECPKTPKGAKVNSAGCWVLDSVLFDINKATIKSGFYSELDNVVNILNNEPDLKVELQGHTCNLGSDVYNLQLSDKRARSVMEYIVSKGIDQTRVSAKGYGETKPFASNDTEEGRKANRRVQIAPIWQ